MTEVSIVVPCRNERGTITTLLQAIYDQTYPRQRMEVVIADGKSTDNTREKIEEFIAGHNDLSVRVLQNPQQTIPSGLNLAISAAAGEVIIRLDAHSVPYPDYVSRLVQSLSEGKGDNVGGVWEIQPGNGTWGARVIAAAASNPFAVGDAYYRFTDQPRLVDTVPFGAFRKQLFHQIGKFDESLLTNEDYEFNVRVRQQGGKVWLNPEIRSIYFARSTFFELARQYWRYGYWKARMLRRYPHTIRWRQPLPPGLVLSFLVLFPLSFVWSCASWLFMIELNAYFLILLAAGFHSAIQKKSITLIYGVPMAIATMYLSWGTAFIWSLITR